MSKIWALVVFVVVCGWAVHAAGLRVKILEERAMRFDLQAQMHEQAREFEQRAREQEQAWSGAMRELSDKLTREVQDAQEAGRRVAVDLRNDNLRLRREWRGCEARMPDNSASAGELDAAADLRAAGAGNLIGNADECDARIRGWQERERALMQVERPAGLEPA